MAVTQTIKLKAIELRAEGLSYDKISRQLKIAKQTAVDIVRESVDQVETLKAIGVEALYEEKRIDCKGRIERLTALHERLEREIGERSLEDVPTDKLILLYLKVSEALKGELQPLPAKSTKEQERDRTSRERKESMTPWL